MRSVGTFCQKLAKKDEAECSEANIKEVELWWEAEWRKRKARSAAAGSAAARSAAAQSAAQSVQATPATPAIPVAQHDATPPNLYSQTYVEFAEFMRKYLQGMNENGVKGICYNNRKAKYAFCLAVLMILHGLPKNVEELMSFPGVGPKICEVLLPLLCIEPVNRSCGVDSHLFRIFTAIRWIKKYSSVNSDGPRRCIMWMVDLHLLNTYYAGLGQLLQYPDNHVRILTRDLLRHYARSAGVRYGLGSAFLEMVDAILKADKGIYNKEYKEKDGSGKSKNSSKKEYGIQPLGEANRQLTDEEKEVLLNSGFASDVFDDAAKAMTIYEKNLENNLKNTPFPMD